MHVIHLVRVGVASFSRCWVSNGLQVWISYILGNICTKKYQNRSMHVEVTVWQSSDIFET